VVVVHPGFDAILFSRIPIGLVFATSVVVAFLVALRELQDALSVPGTPPQGEQRN